MLSSSEIQRVTLSASKYLRIKCQLSLATVRGKEDAKNESLEKTLSTVDVTQSNLSAEQEAPDNIQVEAANTTILSCEPETSFGDMTMDSIRDHIT